MRRIGGSDIAKLLGLSRYGGPLEVYRRIVEGVEEPWNPAMERGAAMEPVLRAHGQRLLGLELEDMPTEYVDSPDYEFARAQVDDFARWQGVPVVAEYKSQSQFARGWLHGADGDVVPDSIAAQVAWQLLCTGREPPLVVVGFGQDAKDGGFNLHNIAHYEVQRELEFERYCLHVAQTFWVDHVLRRVPPINQPAKKETCIMSEATALALVEQPGEEKPSALMRRAVDVAAACKVAVLEASSEINGQRFIEVEGWETIAALYGCTASIRDTVEEERGIKAYAQLKRSDGLVISEAIGFCGLDEPTWSNRAMYARIGMAQTRAISRVCRGVFAFVVVLMKADLRTTPAEEMPGFEPKGAKPSSSAVVDATPSTTRAPKPRPPERTQATRVRFGKSKGKHLADIEASDLQWQLAAARKSVEANDPKWGDANKAWLATVEAEVARRGA